VKGPHVKGTTLAAAVIMVGLAILFGVPLLLGALPTQAYWDDEDQAAYEKASTAAHAATYGGGHDHSQPHSHEEPTDPQAVALRDSTRAAFDREQAKLEAVQSTQYWLGIGCRVLGLIVSAAGVLLYVRSRRAEP
jgi:hypothetical protein